MKFYFTSVILFPGGPSGGCSLDTIEYDMTILEVKRIYAKYIFPGKNDEDIENLAKEHLRFWSPGESIAPEDELLNGKTLKECGYGSDIPANALRLLWVDM